MTSTKTLVGEDSPEVGTSEMLRMGLVRLGVRGADGCLGDLSNALFMSVWVVMIMFFQCANIKEIGRAHV